MEATNSQEGYLCFIERHESGTYGGFCASLPVFVAGKRTFEEAQKALEEGVALYLAHLEAEGRPLPEPSAVAPDLDELEEGVKARLTPVWVRGAS